MEPKFKVGDCVLCVDDKGLLRLKNDGTVYKVKATYKHDYEDKFVIDVEHEKYCYEDRFVLAREYKIKKILEYYDTEGDKI